MFISIRPHVSAKLLRYIILKTLGKTYFGSYIT